MGNRIGELNESSMHNYIKNSIQNNPNEHEVRVYDTNGRLVGIADVLIQSGEQSTIYEIQTKQYYKLKNKIRQYLELGYQVIVVCPVIANKQIYWLDCYTKQTVDIQKSSKKMRDQQIFDCIYELREFLNQIKFMIFNIDIIEYKYLDGYGENHRLKATKLDKVPIKTNHTLLMQCADDYRALVPEMFKAEGKEFNQSEFSKESHISKDTARVQLLVLTKLDIIRRIGKVNRYIIYQYQN